MKDFEAFSTYFIYVSICTVLPLFLVLVYCSILPLIESVSELISSKSKHPDDKSLITISLKIDKLLENKIDKILENKIKPIIEEDRINDKEH
jgi:hypothetical protein